MYTETRDENGVVVGVTKDGGGATTLENTEYKEWVAKGGVAKPDPEWSLEKVKARKLDAIRAAGVSALDSAGYQAHKQTQMTVFVLGEAIKTLMAVIAKTGVVVDTVELGKVVAMIPALTDLTFPQVGAMAAEIGKVRASIMALEAQMMALPVTATVADVKAITDTPMPKPKKRRDIEEGK